MAFLAFLAASSFFAFNVRAEATKSSSGIKPSSLTEQLGAFVIIAGDRSDHELQSVITNGADRVYNDLITYLGFPSDRIYFLGPVVGPTHPKVNATSTIANIQSAIQSWPVGRVSATYGLGLYLFDHGGTDFMCIPGGGGLTDTQLDGYLNALQASSGCSRNIIIYEACHAGSFINTLSKANRIVVTSTDVEHNAFASDTWAYFSESFWGTIAAGQTIGDAFRSGAMNVIISGHGTVQYPLIDDNADMIGNGPLWFTFPIPSWMMPTPFLPNGGDGFDASNTVIRGWNAPVPAPKPKITAMVKHKWVNTTIAVPVWVQVENATFVKKMWAQIIPPYWSPPEPSQPVDNASAIIQDPNINIVELLPTGNSNYSRTFNPVVRGDYRVNIIPEGFGGLGDIIPSIVTLNDNGLPPTDDTPPMVVITNPLASSTLSGSLTISAHGDDDQVLKSVQIFIDGVKVADQAMPAAYPYPDATVAFDTTKYGNGLHQVKAVATDVANQIGTQTITVFVQNPVAFDPTFFITTIVVFAAGFIIGVVGVLYRVRKPRSNKSGRSVKT
jgi:hypothetical protein